MGTFEAVWQDREIRFDTSLELLKPRRGEEVLDSINAVEDTKGNNGERGSLVVTNLRLLWVAHKSARTNLSIGFNTVVSIAIRKAKSKLRGHSQALHLMTKFGGSRFEFVFTSLVQNSPRLFTTTQSVLRAYETSKMYRDLKLRVSIVRDGHLVLLPGESVYTQLDGVWNLSSDQGNLGTIFVTNVRVVWHATLAHNFNVSMPYTQIIELKIRSSKFGPALVVETSKYAGGYVLGFRIDPETKLQHLLKEIQALHAVFAATPVFGVSVDREDVKSADAAKPPSLPRLDDDCDIIDDADARHDAVAAYYADDHPATGGGTGGGGPQDTSGGGGGSPDDVIFDDRLGLAVQRPPPGTTIADLWAIAA